jgi:hypothetical protein
MNPKILWTITIGSLLGCGFLGYTNWQTQKENHKLSLLNAISIAEHRILKDEIASLDRRPTYDEGYKNALIRIGGPQTPGAYQDGWDDCMKVIGQDSNYADGYHAAIQQFGYTKTSTMARWLVPEPKEKAVTGTDKKGEGTPAKFDEGKK